MMVNYSFSVKNAVHLYVNFSLYARREAGARNGMPAVECKLSNLVEKLQVVILH